MQVTIKRKTGLYTIYKEKKLQHARVYRYLLKRGSAPTKTAYFASGQYE